MGTLVKNIMGIPSEKEIAGLLVNIINDGFNRSLNALEQARAIDTKELQSHYKGTGSKYYDLVTEQIQLTAKYGAVAIHQHLANNNIQKKDS
jgi:hypothetical protein